MNKPTLNDLLWELYLMVRDTMPPTAANAARQAVWSQKFFELGTAMPPAGAAVQSNTLPIDALNNPDNPATHP
jgi:enamine deaminase RidA (YjgF/YER057c/UK114 family)